MQKTRSVQHSRGLIFISIAIALAGNAVACGDGRLQPSLDVEAIRAQSCVSLGAGESAVVHSEATSLPADYLLSRSDLDGIVTYEAGLALRFRGLDEHVQAVSARARACLDSWSPFLLAESGEKLRIRLLDPAAAPAGLSSVDISISPSAKNYSRMWNPEIECPSILHEVLHLLGLVDEYEDPQFDCRTIGPRESVMHFETFALYSVSENNLLLQCECPVDEKEKVDTECEAQLKALRGVPRDCPSKARLNLVRAVSRYELNNGTERAAGLKKTIERDFQEYRAGVYLPSDHSYRFWRLDEPVRKSILLPAQFETIVHPNCPDRNALYYRCAAYAYRSSASAEGCLEDRPAECRPAENSRKP